MSRIRMTIAQVDAIRNQLLALPPIEPEMISKQQIISRLIPVIEKMVAKGYTRAAIASRLTEKGIPISASTLTTYLRRAHMDHAGELPEPVSTAAQPLRPAAREPRFEDIADEREPLRLPMPPAVHRANASPDQRRAPENKPDDRPGRFQRRRSSDDPL